ncbi:Patatin [Xanthobacter versatilis]|uniref:Patatin n=1 Tax=Xanthobacter autotrophicus (strain ATCC BAA-1158 / Py2) TaxID=78245 RepID=A7IF45_XANP2|nr:Patatin [Xanthobacter autotrophicus Py2]
MPRIAIACQGGGSHAAFAAGVLLKLLSPEFRSRFDLVRISGTSGGAMCAALVWAGLIAEGGGPDEAIKRLRGFWETLKADDLPSYWTNMLGLATARLPLTMEVSPYLIPAPAAAIMRDWLTEHLRLDELRGRPVSPPELLVGATDVLSGRRVVIGGEKLTYDALIASAAVPFLYEAVPFENYMLWDGLFSVNPPVRDLIDCKIDQLWVVRINPLQRDTVPRGSAEIIDRRNELSGNTALDQELDFANTINELVKLSGGELGKYRHVEVHVLDSRLNDVPDETYDYASKFNRAPGFIDGLIRRGSEAAPSLLDESTLWTKEDSRQTQPKRL